MSRTIDGRFTLGPAIGAGAASEVYRARDELTGEDVALKLATASWPRAEVTLRFEREAAALALLASPHVVHLVAAGAADDGTPYLAMELLAGRDLQEEVRKEGGLLPHDVLAWFVQAAAAVDLAHGLGIVHRDLKPGNLFLHDRGDERTLKVLDFGLVKDTTGDLWASGDAFVGTPLYMAPEQVRGHSTRVGPATDVWALGMVAVTLLTGETYWRGPTVGETIADIDGAPLYPPSSRWPWLPPAFDHWFARSCHRVGDKRFRSAAAQAAGLGVALRGVVVREAPAERRAQMAVVSTMLGQRTSDLTALDSELAQPEAIRGHLVGRQVELRELEGKLGAPGIVVSVTGTGGCGKTRLALAAAGAVADRIEGGVWIVRLAGARDLASAVAQALGLPPDATRSDADRVAAALAEVAALIVVDGLEQVAGAADTLIALRDRMPRVSWLVTSRLPPGIPGEIRLALEPLERPTSAKISINEAASYAAVQLFLMRAREGAPDFVLDESNVEHVTSICRLVDGLPLALELAAARVKDRSVAEVAAALAGSEDLSAGTVGWSFGLLGPREKLLLSRVALMPGGATFEGAVEICRGAVTAEEVAGAIQLLVDGSLVSWTPDQPPRLQMLATVREFCRTRGEPDPEGWPAVLGYLTRVVEQGAEGVRGALQERWLAIFDAEWTNLRGALARTEAEDPPAMLRLAAGLAWFWYLRGHYREGLRWLEAALAGAPHADERGKALQGAGELAFLLCHYGEAEALLLRAAALADERGLAAAEQMLGSIARERGDYAAARARHQRSLEAWRAIGDRREAARAENYLVFLDWLEREDAGAPAGSSAAAAATGEAFAELGHVEGGVWSRLHQGAIAAYAGERPVARRHLTRAFADAVSAKYQEGIAWALNLLGVVSTAAGEWVQARAQLRASLQVHRRLGDLWRCASVLEAFAAVCADTGDVARAGELLAAAAALRQRIGAPVPACERARYARTAEKAVEAERVYDLDTAVALVAED